MRVFWQLGIQCHLVGTLHSCRVFMEMSWVPLGPEGTPTKSDRNKSRFNKVRCETKVLPTCQSLYLLTAGIFLSPNDFSLLHICISSVNQDEMSFQMVILLCDASFVTVGSHWTLFWVEPLKSLYWFCFFRFPLAVSEHSSKAPFQTVSMGNDYVLWLINSQYYSS